MTAYIRNFISVVSILLNTLQAADTWNIDFDHIELKSKNPDVQIKVDVGGKDRKPIMVALRWNGKDYKVPVSEFAGITDVSMSTLRVVSTMPRRFVATPDGHGSAYISVCMEYGKRIYMKGINPVDPEADNSFRARVFFLFHAAGYSHRERVEPIEQGDRWKLFAKYDVAKPETFQGEERGPFPTDDPPLVPVVEWHAVDKPATPPETKSKDEKQPTKKSDGPSQ